MSHKTTLSVADESQSPIEARASQVAFTNKGHREINDSSTAAAPEISCAWTARRLLRSERVCGLLSTYLEAFLLVTSTTDRPCLRNFESRIALFTRHRGHARPFM
ncbi:hypothetical protein CCGE525_37455 (plasmid) [Rhizobium jaguaris]|uniref:Uncharacterized protein n=1 Tax=Rhizobium jaguaris TaxID=1312183 RepID=A0A387G0H8_9HYPH|nr:hypothetical protein CCGE525_37455 [Rhizobium jaguaris]